LFSLFFLSIMSLLNFLSLFIIFPSLLILYRSSPLSIFLFCFFVILFMSLCLYSFHFISLLSF
jgi:hypothetical protein